MKLIKLIDTQCVGYSLLFINSCPTDGNDDVSMSHRSLVFLPLHYVSQTKLRPCYVCRYLHVTYALVIMQHTTEQSKNRVISRSKKKSTPRMTDGLFLLNLTQIVELMDRRTLFFFKTKSNIPQFLTNQKIS